MYKQFFKIILAGKNQLELYSTSVERALCTVFQRSSRDKDPDTRSLKKKMNTWGWLAGWRQWFLLEAAACVLAKASQMQRQLWLAERTSKELVGKMKGLSKIKSNFKEVVRGRFLSLYKLKALLLEVALSWQTLLRICRVASVPTVKCKLSAR